MLYQSYVEKLEKWRHVFDRVWRLRFVFLATFLLILAGIGALLGIQGIVHDVHVPESIVYGETFSPTAEAIFGDAEFEYRRAGESEWTRETPYLAGEYECRAFGRSVVGTDRPAEAVSFAIEPALAHIRTTATSLVFGEALPFTTSDLKYGDTLVVDGFLAEEIEGQKLNVQADPAKIRVLNEAGEDVSFCYTFDPQERSIDDLRRPVTLSTTSETFVYDGTAHESRGLTAEGLVDGHTVKAVFASITDVGTCRNELTSVQIFDADGNDMTDHYRINIVSTGTLTVTKRPITVSTASDRFTYDGKAHDYMKAEVSEGTLAGGQELLLSACLSALNAGEYSNAPTVRIMAGEADVTANYEIAEDFGTVTVAPLAVTLKTASYDKFVYNGKPQTPEEQPSIVEGTALIEGHSVTVDYVGRTDAATYENDIIESSVRVVDKDGGEIPLGNYKFTWRKGSVTILPLAVTLKTASDDGIVYNGKPQAPAGQPFPTGGTALAAGHSVTAEYVGRTDADTYENDFLEDSVRVFDERGGIIPLGNYTFTWEKGSVTIHPLSVTLEAASDDTIVYNGAPQSTSKRPFPVDGTALAEGHFVTVEYVGHTDAGTYVNEAIVSSVKVIDGSGEEIPLGNYKFTWEKGTVTIRKRPITIETASNGSFIYDGTPHSDDGYEVRSELDLVSGHTLSYNAPTIVNVGESVENIFEHVTVHDGEEKDVSNNYEIEWEWGVLTVGQRPITIETKENSWTYDGTEHSDTSVRSNTEEGQNVGLLSSLGHTIVVDGEHYSRFINVSDSGKNIVKYCIHDGEGNDLTENYKIEYVYGDCSITPKEVTAVAKTETLTYDGEEHVYGADTLTGRETLVSGHSFAIDGGEYCFTEANEDGYVNRPTVYVTEDGVSRSENYTVTVKEGSIVVKKRRITITTQSYHEIYDGLMHDLSSSPASYTPESGEEGLLSFHSFVADAHAQYYGVISEANQTTYRIVQDGLDVTENYEITYKNGTVTIDPRPITVMTQSDSWVYDGTDHAEKLWSPIVAGDGIAENDEIRSFGELKRFCNVSESGENTVAYRIYNRGGDDVTGNYSDFADSITYGNIVITQRPLYIRTPTTEWVYDAENHLDTNYTISERVDSKDGGSGLVEGHVVFENTFEKVTVVCNVADARQSDKKQNIFEVTLKIKSESGEDVTENYDTEHLHYIYGTLTILPRPIAISTASNSWVYDGKPHFDDSCVWESFSEDRGLLDVHDCKFSVSEKTVMTDYVEGGKTNELTYTVAIVEKTGGADVTGNYDISRVTGTLMILKRSLTIETQSEHWTYDGREHVLSTEPVFSYAAEDTGEETGLIKGETLQAVSSSTYEFVADTGKENIVTYQVYRNGSEITRNYEIEYRYGTVTIDRRPLRMKTGSASFVYNGTERQCFQYELLPKEPEDGEDFGLLKGLGHSILILSSTSLIDVGSRPNVIKFLIMADGVPVTENYVSLTGNSDYMIYGTIEITQRPISVVAMTETVTYRGEAFEYGTPDRLTSYEIDDGEAQRGLLQDLSHEIRISNAEKLRFTDASDKPYENIPEIAIYENGQDVTRNYAVTVTNGEITIQRRHIDPKTASDEFVYDGIGRFYRQETITCGVNEEGKSQLAEGHQFSITSDESTYFFKEANEAGYTNDPTFVILDASRKDVSKNYDIAPTDCGKVVIHKRPITIVSDSKTWVHDGKEHEYASAHALDTWDADSGLLYGLSHKIRVTVAARSRLTEITDTMSAEGGYYDRMGFVTNEIDTYHIFEADRDVTENYIVTVQNDGQLRIKSPIVIFLYSFSKDFDGMSLAESLIESELDENLFYDVEQRPPEIDESAIRIDWSKLEDVYAVGMTLIAVKNRISVTWGGQENDPDRIDRVEYVADVGDDEALFEITPRRLIVTSGSYRAARKDRVTFTYQKLTISDIQFFEEGGGEFTYSCDFTGILKSDESSASNTFKNFRVYDAEGKDLTGLAFAVEYRYGILSWIDDETDTVSAQSLPALPARKEM